MPEAMDYVLYALLIGTGATVAMDFWTMIQKHLLKIPTLDYRLLGRWIVYLTRGRFFHDPIAASPPVGGEQFIGWAAHYLTGIFFAGILLAICGLDWVRHPTPGPALLTGIATLAAPFLLMQPGMGAGIAASRTPRPNVARLRSLVTHTIFGLGLYIAALLASLL